MYLGIDIGGTNIAFGVIGENFEIIHKESIKTRTDRTDIEIISEITDICARTIEDFSVKSIGIGTPGRVDIKNGVFIGAANLPFNNTPVVELLQNKLSLPVYINNDANCAALGELYAGEAQNANSLFVVTLGTGIGGGIIIDRKIYTGVSGGAGEIGHTCIDMHGEKCKCGRYGCWEMYASATALISQTKRAAMSNPDSLLYQMKENISGRTAFEAMRQGCKIAEAVVEQYIRFLSIGIMDVVKLIQPEIIVISGGLSSEKEYLLEPLMRYISGNTKVNISKIGNDAGIIGAALLGKAEG